VALYSSGRLAGAIDLLDKTWRAHPGDRQVLSALLAYVRERGDLARAQDLATRLVAISPGDTSATSMLEEIRGKR
jgi:Flp pilus assembly protein TadD